MKCQWKGCDKDATHYPKVMVPSWNVPIQHDQPLPCLIGLASCLHHSLKFDVQEFIDMPTPQGGKTNRDVFETLAASVKRPRPNFGSAFILPVAIDSEEARGFDEARNADKPVPAGG